MALPNTTPFPVTSTPTFSAFDPREVPYQCDVINDVKFKFDYSIGVHEVLLTGSVGSAKSLLLAHLIVRHCIEWPGAKVLIGREALQDLRDTLYLKIRQHLSGTFIKGEQYQDYDSTIRIAFSNGSEIMGRSWHDGDIEKFGSLELSMAVIEELTENKKPEFYKKIYERVGRLPHVRENIVISATNPDSPSHWAYAHFEMDLDDPYGDGESRRLAQEKRSPAKHVYYSKTRDNKFLPTWYIENLKKIYDDKMYLRMGEGIWIEINQEVIYYNYLKSRNYRAYDYEINEKLPIRICFDFNIALGKPLSLCLFQWDGRAAHFFDEVILDTASTEEALEELENKGHLSHNVKYIIHGDATGESKSTKSKKSDYDIIRKYLANVGSGHDRLDFEIKVPKSNPPIRTRHNTVNAYFRNKLGEIRLYVYKNCKTLDEGFRLTALKKGGSFIEDDSKAYQHVTTAAGYGICSLNQSLTSTSGTKSVKVR